MLRVGKSGQCFLSASLLTSLMPNSIIWRSINSTVARYATVTSWTQWAHLTQCQIKNAISSAQTIGLANGSPRLTIKDIGVVLDVLSDWNVAMGKRDGVAHQEKDV